jgi:hypothetical protein
LGLWPCGHVDGALVVRCKRLLVWGQVASPCFGRNVPHCFQRDPQVKVSKSRLFSQFELAELPQNCRSHGWFASIRLELPHRGCQRGVAQSEMSAGHVISQARLRTCGGGYPYGCVSLSCEYPYSTPSSYTGNGG